MDSYEGWFQRMVDQRTANRAISRGSPCASPLVTTAPASKPKLAMLRRTELVHKMRTGSVERNGPATATQPKVLAIGRIEIEAARRSQPRTPQRDTSDRAQRPGERPSEAQRRSVAPREDFLFRQPDAKSVSIKILNVLGKVTPAGIKTYQAKFRRKELRLCVRQQDRPEDDGRWDCALQRARQRNDASQKSLRRRHRSEGHKTLRNARKYVEKKDLDFGEYWVCDGGAIYQFDSRTKTVTETQLPPELRGKAIGEGPLPFMFGAKAATMKQRYWIQRSQNGEQSKGRLFSWRRSQSGSRTLLTLTAYL